MGGQGSEKEISRSARSKAPQKVVKYVCNCNSGLPKGVPQATKSCKASKGDGRPDTKKITPVEGSKYDKLNYKHEVVVREKVSSSCTIVKRGSIGKKIEIKEKEFKVEANKDGEWRCTTKACNKYYREEIKVKGSGLFKAPYHC